MRKLVISNLKNLYVSVEYLSKLQNIKFTPFVVRDDFSKEQIKYVNNYLCNVVKHPHYQYLNKGIDLSKLN